MKAASDLEFALLAIAVRESTGRQLAQEYEKRNKRPISYGSLYTTLRRMVEAGWLKQREDADQDGRLRWYVITGDGRRAHEIASSRRRDVLRGGFAGGEVCS